MTRARIYPHLRMQIPKCKLFFLIITVNKPCKRRGKLYFNSLSLSLSLTPEISRFINSTRLHIFRRAMQKRNDTTRRSLSVAKQVARRCIVHLFIGEKIETDGRPWHRRREGSSNSWQLIRLS